MIEINNFIYNIDEKGNWVFKAKEQEPILKKKLSYSEKPQFKIIYDIESHMRGQMDNEIKTAVKEILEILKP